MSLRFQPTKKLFIISVICFALSFILFFKKELLNIFLLGLTAIILLSLIDLIFVLFKPLLIATRNIAHNLPVGKSSNVELFIQNKSSKNTHLEIYDLHPQSFTCESMPVKASLPKGETLNISYKVEPKQRGDHVFSGVECRSLSFLGLWKTQFIIECLSEVKVYPNFSDMKYLSILAADNQLSRLGIYIQQMRGSGMEFNQLREYQQGDSVRQIDWHASAKFRKLISKEFQEERDQEIICLLDCSRRMRGLESGKPYFDHALNAMIQLGQIIVRQGDAFGFLAFSGQDRWFKPSKGFSAINAVLNTVYDLQATSAPSDYIMAAERILQLQKKRAMIVLITNSRNEDTGDLQAAARLLQRKHLVVIADIRDPLLDQITTNDVNDFNEAKVYLHGVEYQETRKRTHQRLLHNKIMMLDTKCEELPLRLIHSYFEIKRLHSL